MTTEEKKSDMWQQKQNQYTLQSGCRLQCKQLRPFRAPLFITTEETKQNLEIFAQDSRMAQRLSLLGDLINSKSRRFCTSLYMLDDGDLLHDFGHNDTALVLAVISKFRSQSAATPSSPPYAARPNNRIRKHSLYDSCRQSHCRYEKPCQS